MNNLAVIIEKRKHEDRFRQLPRGKYQIDFSSNDYLGLSGSLKLKKLILNELQRFPDYKNGSTGSRLLSGNTDYAEHLEEEIAGFHGAEAALIFNSGYDANVGLFGCIAHRNDTIIYDELSHASILDGIRLSFASSYKFQHNNLTDFEDKLKRSKGTIYVAVESVYSMDGDFAPLKELIKLCNQYEAMLIVDEAHATGIFEEEGRGRSYHFRNDVFARVFTFGKALGVHGAAIAGSAVLRNYLINFARSFIYSTALPFHSLVSIHCAYEVMKQADDERKKLHALIDYFQSKAVTYKEINFIKSSSAIQGVIIHGNKEVKTTAGKLQTAGFDVRPVLSPTVPQGKERLRICLHSFNTEEEVDKLMQEIS